MKIEPVVTIAMVGALAGHRSAEFTNDDRNVRSVIARNATIERVFPRATNVKTRACWLDTLNPATS